LDPFSRKEYAKGSLQNQLLYGALPFIATEPSEEAREQALRSYVTTYLEEEVRAEALVRNLSPFGRFLELAASEAGSLINLRKLSQEIGVSHVTIGSYFQILEDCLIVERIESLTHSSTRKKLTRGSKYLFFDLGVRRLAAQEGRRLPRESWGKLLEQWVGLELLRAIRQSSGHLRFWRDPDGPEVDWVIEQDGGMIPFEVKWTEAPTVQDARHLQTFLSEYPEAQKGFIICRTPHALSLAPHIRAIPWQELPGIALR
jgi:predicted AAA+ superfamily ATPase